VPHNRLLSVPKELGHLARLETLDLSHNQLTQVPKELGQLSHLEQLDVSGNQLGSLPKELGRLSQLHTLDLSNNPELAFPPPEIVARGVEAVLAYLRAQQGDG
jgi:internalin A